MSKKVLRVCVSEKAMENLVRLAEFRKMSVSALVCETLDDLDADELISFCEDKSRSMMFCILCEALGI